MAQAFGDVAAIKIFDKKASRDEEKDFGDAKKETDEALGRTDEDKEEREKCEVVTRGLYARKGGLGLVSLGL